MDFQYFYIFLVLNFVYQICAQCENGNVRLTGGPNKFEGRVELCVDGNWGQVCATGWTTTDAEVMCRQLGHSSANSQHVLNGVYNGEAAPARVHNFQCNGNELKLVDCSHTAVPLGSSGCDGHSGPAGVVCPDSVCLSDSASTRLSDEQVVEVCSGGGFRTGVCSDGWDDADASVVCRQLSLGDSGVASSTGSIVYRMGGAYDKVNCTNSDERLSDCERALIGGANPRDRCSTRQFAQVECKDSGGPATIVASTTLAATTMPPAETTGSTLTTGFEDTDSTTADVEQTPMTKATTDPLQGTVGPQSQSDSQLLAIVLGIVGGLIVLLLFGIIVLLVIVVLGRQRRKYSVQYLDDSINGKAVVASMQVKAKEDQLANSYSSQKGDPEHHLLNPLYLQNQEQMANSNPLPYTSVVTPPSTADDSQVHEYATLDNFQPTVSQWPPEQPQEYSNPLVPNTGEKDRTSGVPNVYSEPILPGENYKVGEDGIVTDLQGYASLDPTAHSYDYAVTSRTTKSNTEGMSTLPVPQAYETPFESSYEDASSTNITPVSSRRESPERRETSPAINHTSLQAEETISPYAEPSPVSDDKLANTDKAASTHDYATLEPPK